MRKQRAPCLYFGVIGDDLAVQEAATLLVHLHKFNSGDGGHDGALISLLTAQREQLVLGGAMHWTLNGAT